MKKSRYAVFVETPRTIEDLIQPQGTVCYQAFSIVQIVKLRRIDYENFTTDLLADRQLIEDYETVCSYGEVWNCLLVKRYGHKDGVLVMPGERRHVGWAALYSG